MFIVSTAFASNPESSQIRVRRPEPGLVQFEICRNDECEPFGSETGLFAVDALKHRAGPRPSAKITAALNVFGLGSIAATVIAVVGGVINSPWPSIESRTWMYLPGILGASLAMELSGRRSEQRRLGQLDAEILSRALAGETFDHTADQALLEYALLRTAACRKALSL